MKTINHCRFSYAGTWEIVNLFFGQKVLETIFIMKTWAENNKIPTLKSRLQETDRPWKDRTEQYASKEECIK